MHLFKRADANGTVLLPPRPYVVPTTGTFDGNDGKWSTFFINVGASDRERGQNFKVLPFTSSPITILPAEASWCNDDDCAKRRGVQPFQGKQALGFQTDSSQSWKKAGIYDFYLPEWWNRTIGGNWGTDTVGLGESTETSEMLGEQYVGLSQDKDLFLGSFGLSAGEAAPGGASKPTFIVNFDGFERIASTSYGYTAGASYRNNGKGVPGSLVLGGYDRSRLKDLGTSIRFPNEKNTTLSVGVQSITYQPAQGVEDSTSSFTTDGGFEATIDSTLPYLELPDDIINKFVDKFRLSFDKDRKMYTVNTSSHNHNKQQNAVVSFKIGESVGDSTAFANIDLPYDAFDLTGSTPLFDNETMYFPIKKSEKGIMVLGRTFLQEAYIIVDYERSNFTVAPAAFSDPMPDRDLVTIFNKTYVMPVGSDSPPASSGGGGLAPGAIAGIVVGVVLVFVLGAVAAFFWWRRRRTQQPQPPVKEMTQEDKGSDIDTVVAGNEVKYRRVSELSGSQPAGSPKPSVGGYYGGGDVKEGFPPISEMSPESPPAELYSPPQGSMTPYSEGSSDYFIAGNKIRGRGATSGHSPGTPAPIAELPGDDGGFQVGGQKNLAGSKGNIDEVMSRSEKPSEKTALAAVSPAKEATEENKTEPAVEEDKTAPAQEEDKVASEQAADESEEPKSTVSDEAKKDSTEAEPTTERRPSHTRGLSDLTVQSESTAVSQPTPEELEQWATGSNEPRRPLSQ